MTVKLLAGDCLEILPTLPENSIDAVCTDPPYHLTSIVKRFGSPDAAPVKVSEFFDDGGNSKGSSPYKRISTGFMGKQWDGGDIAQNPKLWAEVLRVLKPGGHMVAFSGTRTYHRMACAIEDAGFEIRDQLAWVYGQGFPKSLDISKAIDKAAGAKGEFGEPKSAAHAGWIDRGRMRGDEGHEGFQRPWMQDEEAVDRAARQYLPATDAARQWSGWGSALKPCFEPICLARKPLSEPTIAANVLKWGVGALNIDACRIISSTGQRPNGEITADFTKRNGQPRKNASRQGLEPPASTAVAGRWPGNFCHDGSQEVLDLFPAGRSAYPGRQDLADAYEGTDCKSDGVTWKLDRAGKSHSDSGSAARFFASFPQEEECTPNGVNDAEPSFPLSSAHVVSALARAVEASTPQSELIRQGFQGHFTSVTESELSEICRLVTETILSFVSRRSLGRQPARHILSSEDAQCVAIPKQTDIIEITASLWKSSGFAEVVTFSITLPNSAVGAKDYAPSRFMYCAKASKADRAGSKHPTVKPVALMRWLCRMVTPPGGTVLDPFAGSGTTGQAAIEEGFDAILIEREAEYLADIERRLETVRDDAPLLAAAE